MSGNSRKNKYPEIIKNNDGTYNISDSRFVLYKDENGKHSFLEWYDEK